MPLDVDESCEWLRAVQSHGRRRERSRRRSITSWGGRRASSSSSRTWRRSTSARNVDNPWLDPIGFAFGVEYRREEISGYVDPQYQDGWIVGNFLPTFGDYNVKEAYIEALVPLPFGLELNTAARGTDYSTLGFRDDVEGGADVVGAG